MHGMQRLSGMLISLAFFMAAILAWLVMPSEGAVGQAPAKQKQDQRPFERRSPSPVKVPYPGSLDPTQVVANIQAYVRQTTFGESVGIDDLGTASLRATRILQVRSEMPPPGFLVVELSDQANNSVAVVAITRRGVMLAAQDVRTTPSIRPINLEDAAARVGARRGRKPIRTEYVYAHNNAEPGLSILRPLAVVHTEKGPLFFNTRQEVFAEEGSTLLTEFAPQDQRRRGIEANPPAAGELRLRLLGRW